jgi:hypothetical protein
MKELDDLIKKVGNDKVLHFLGGGWICQLLHMIFFPMSLNHPPEELIQK